MEECADSRLPEPELKYKHVAGEQEGIQEHRKNFKQRPQLWSCLNYGRELTQNEYVIDRRDS